MLQAPGQPSQTSFYVFFYDCFWRQAVLVFLSLPMLLPLLWNAAWVIEGLVYIMAFGTHPRSLIPNVKLTGLRFPVRPVWKTAGQLKSKHSKVFSLNGCLAAFSSSGALLAKPKSVTCPRFTRKVYTNSVLKAWCILVSPHAGTSERPLFFFPCRMMFSILCFPTRNNLNSNKIYFSCW